MEGGADDLSPSLIEVMPFVYTPSRVCYPIDDISYNSIRSRCDRFLVRIFIIRGFFLFPGEDSPIFANGINLKEAIKTGVGKKPYETHCVAICREISTQNSISVTRKSFRSESFDWVQGKETSCHVPRRGDEASGCPQVSSSYT
jgi:hypothetical protein